ncbi:hypothetical protein AB0F13_00705 [Streptomyces sp. NPDC026206]|uniref:hypothetical protein n=1 Tax=Streptomyces sp. NPDC026206 TaxID=3157089 RepID=UPI0033C32CD8
MNVRKSFALATATLALGGGLAVAPAASAAPASTGAASQSCRQDSITVPSDRGAVAYIECRRNNHGTWQSSTQIWVYDKKADGKCVYGTVKIGNWSKTYKACPKGNDVRGERSGWHNGYDAQVTMSIR